MTENNLSRREFLKRTLAAGVAGGVVLSNLDKVAAAAEPKSEGFGTMIDLTRCDGCPDQKVPRCVQACRAENKDRFPRPAENIPDYWPQKKKEDWRGKENLTTRLTPYNWTFVQHVQVEHKGRTYKLHIPRRCMHCLNPPCANLCPFSAQEVTKEGAVVINPDLCFGGAKCREVCPWGIPARQAGVGLYMKVMPELVGGGVMYKCDMCSPRLAKGQTPACVEACPRGAITFGPRSQILAQAKKRAEEINGYIYGEKENGGTRTFYVSPVPFTLIDAALKKEKAKQPNPDAPGFPTMPVGVGNYLDTANGIAKSLLIAPVAGIFAAGYAAYRSLKGGEKDER
ncbi:MAG: formate dehydrogenase iron-sulfur subunit [Eubacteriales bacterium]|nr:formate dehydrogenase iron-sulfur subunit [Eubacteriales bacterium]